MDLDRDDKNTFAHFNNADHTDNMSDNPFSNKSNKIENCTTTDDIEVKIVDVDVINQSETIKSRMITRSMK